MRKGSKHTLESKKKIAKKQTGKHHSEETKKKLSEIKKGKKFSLEHRRNLGKKRKGKNHYNWQGGKSFEPYGTEFDNYLKEFIKTRDGYRCQECFKHESELFSKKGKPRKLACHHINYLKKDNQNENIISLCPKCHGKTNFKRKDWTKYFQKKISLKGEIQR